MTDRDALTSVAAAPDLAGAPVIATELAPLRRASKMTRAGLADLVDVGEADVARWERSAPIPPELAPLLADLFGVSIAWLLGETDYHRGRKA